MNTARTHAEIAAHIRAANTAAAAAAGHADASEWDEDADEQATAIIAAPTAAAAADIIRIDADRTPADTAAMMGWLQYSAADRATDRRAAITLHWGI